MYREGATFIIASLLAFRINVSLVNHGADNLDGGLTSLAPMSWPRRPGLKAQPAFHHAPPRSGSNYPAIVPRDQHCRGARSGSAVAGWKAQLGVLYVDPHGAVVRAPGDAGDLAAARADQETTHLACARIGAQQLVGTHGLHHRLVVAVVGLDPQATLGIEGQTVRRGKTVTVDGSGQVRRDQLAVCIAHALPLAGEQEDFPLEARRCRITALLVPAQDLP